MLLHLSKQGDIMDKLQISQILVKDARLEVIKLSGKNVAQLIDETKQKQAEVLKLKEIDQESLKRVVQL
jgi:hypothetical protein